MTASMQELLKDEKVWAIAARVALHDGESDHFEISNEGHIWLNVVTLRHGVPLRALLKGGDDAGTGVWFIPSVGTEVMINFDDGEFEGDAYVVAVVGEKPSNLNVQANKVYVIGPEVQIRSVGGTAKKLSLHDELKALRDFVYNQFSGSNGHVHAVAGAATTTMVTVASAASPPTPIVPENPVGTTVAKGE